MMTIIYNTWTLKLILTELKTITTAYVILQTQSIEPLKGSLLRCPTSKKAASRPRLPFWCSVKITDTLSSTRVFEMHFPTALCSLALHCGLSTAIYDVLSCHRACTSAAYYAPQRPHEKSDCNMPRWGGRRGGAEAGRGANHRCVTSFLINKVGQLPQ